MEVTFGFAPDERKDRELIIPMLVMRGGHLCHPIIGYHVIEQVANRNGLTQPHSSETLVNAIPNLEGDKIRAFIERVQAEHHVSTSSKPQRKKSMCLNTPLFKLNVEYRHRHQRKKGCYSLNLM